MIAMRGSQNSSTDVIGVKTYTADFGYPKNGQKNKDIRVDTWTHMYGGLHDRRLLVKALV